MTALNYSDVYLKPRYSTLRSRSDADVSVNFLGRKLALPVCPSNMESVIDVKTARWLSENDYAYIMHRFGDTKAFIALANEEKWKLISISVGVKQADRDLINWIGANNLRVDWICIDVANGHSVYLKEMIEYIKTVEFRSCYGDYAIGSGCRPGRSLASVALKYYPKIIAGNVATPEGVRDIASWGADACKIGVGPSGVCTTKNMTGFHVPMFTCAKDCSREGGGKQTDALGFVTRYSVTLPSRIPLIYDGGVRENGDIAKALVAANGVTSIVMMGGLFAACIDDPGKNVTIEEETEESKKAKKKAKRL